MVLQTVSLLQSNNATSSAPIPKSAGVSREAKNQLALGDLADPDVVDRPGDLRVQQRLRDAASTVLPMFMSAAAFVVFLLNAIAGTVAQRRNELRALEALTSDCVACRRSDGPLHMVDYHWYLFLGVVVFQFGQCRKFCTSCARARIDSMFRRTVWGSLFCPPLILWGWIQRRRILQRLQ